MAVFTPLTDDDVCTLLRGYDLGQFQALDGIAQGVENSNFHLYTDRGHYILTIFEGRTDLTALNFYFAAMDHWRTKGILCPHVLPDRQGARLQTAAGKPAAILSFLQGRGVIPNDITPDLCAQVGALCAQMHQTGLGFQQKRGNNVGFTHWQKMADLCLPVADAVHAGLAQIIQTELAALNKSWARVQNLPSGLVHADLFPDNVFIDGDGQICGVIDFYFSCTDAYVYDLAITMNAWCFDPSHVFDPVRSARFLDAYQAVRRLTDEEIGVFQTVARGAALRFLLSRLYDITHRPAGAVVTPKDPLEYLKKLEFHQQNKVF